jgi:hypothetical protein
MCGRNLSLLSSSLWLSGVSLSSRSPSRFSKVSGTLLCVSAFVLGCAQPRVVIIPPGEPVQLAEDVYSYVYVKLADNTYTRSKNRVRLWEGLWVVPDE